MRTHEDPSMQSWVSLLDLSGVLSTWQALGTCHLVSLWSPGQQIFCCPLPVPPFSPHILLASWHPTHHPI